MPYCPNCGKKVGNTANFCRACGFDLKAEETPIGTEKAESKNVIPEQAEQVTAIDASKPTAETSISPSLQRAHIRKTAARYIVCSLVTFVISGVFTPFLYNRGLVAMSIVMWIISILLWTYGWGCYAESKGRSNLWGLLGLLGLWGIAVLALQPIKPIEISGSKNSELGNTNMNSSHPSGGL